MKKNLKHLIIVFIILVILFSGLYLIDYILSLKSDPYDIYYINGLLDSRMKITCYEENLDYCVYLKKNEEIPEKKEGTKRILVVGDSFVYGFGNSNPNTLMWKRLEYKLKQEGYNDVEVYASGITGTSTADQIKKIFQDTKTLEYVQPDLIIFALVPNDLENIFVDNEYVLKYFNTDKFINDFYNYKILNMLKKLYPNIYNKIMDTVIENKKNEPGFYEKYGKEYGYDGDVRTQIAIGEGNVDISKEYIKWYYDNIKIETAFFECFDYNYDISGETFKILETIFKKYDMNFYNYYDNFKNDYLDLPIEDMWISLIDPHPSELMNDIYATYMLDMIKNNYLDIIGEKSDVQNFELEIDDWVPYDVSLSKIEENKYEFTVPSNQFNYPLGIDYFKLNFKYPVNISKICLESSNIESGIIYTNNYMEDKKYNLLTSDGNCYLVDSSNETFSLNISLTLKNMDENKVIMTIE